MASVSQLNQFPCKSFSITPPRSQSRPGGRISSLEFTRVKLVFRVQVNDDDEWGLKKDNPVKESSAKNEEKSVEPKEIVKLKKVLVYSFYGTDHGLKSLSETRTEIVELIAQLEAQNLNPALTEALSLLNGKWFLRNYTYFPGLFPLLSRGTLPLVKVEEISQTIDLDNFIVQSSVYKILYSLTLDFLYLIICMVSMTNDHHGFVVSDSWLLTPLGNF
ncbi:hypothetical protein UlMin_006757 [Ulmus minor]